jgi:DNA repair exonuclease SbcCD nuclease subunit
MRTLVISDLHLGMRYRRDVLRLSAPLEVLLEALSDVDRLVLLGDVVDLSEHDPQDALAAAEPVLRALGRQLGPDREVIVVPGNHDRRFVAPWIQEMGARLAVDSAVPLDATPELAAVSSWLAPALVSARYPGVWLSNRVWATHGHYLNRDLLPAWSRGITHGHLGRLREEEEEEEARPVDYESAGGRSLRSAHEAISGALPEPLAAAADRFGVLARAATMAKASRKLLRPELARANAALLSLQTTVASIPALIHVTRSLGIDADYVVFGHVHRLGPLPGDEEADWAGAGGRPRIVNTGSWIYEPLLVGDVTPPHPYWPGGAAILEDEAGPQPVGLLDTTAASALR